MSSQEKLCLHTHSWPRKVGRGSPLYGHQALMSRFSPRCCLQCQFHFYSYWFCLPSAKFIWVIHRSPHDGNKHLWTFWYLEPRGRSFLHNWEFSQRARRSDRGIERHNWWTWVNIEMWNHPQGMLIAASKHWRLGWRRPVGYIRHQ